MMMEAMEDIDEEVMVGGKLLKNVRFADDQGMVADSEDGLQKLMDGLVKAATSYDMKINVKKAKDMRVSRKEEGIVNIVIEGVRVEQVDRFKYLGSMITADGRCESEIRIRIGMAKMHLARERNFLHRK